MDALQRTIAEQAAIPAGRRRLTDLAFLAALILFVGIAYGPSLKHPPRADQWCFLADTIDDHTFLDTLRHSYSYNRTRHTSPGDTDLFRPILFTLLAAEKAAFGGCLALTQGLGVVLHCGVCVLFLGVLRRISAIVQPAEAGGAGIDLLAYAVVTFFAFNPLVQELVIWSHLHGYLLFLVFLLGSLFALLRAAEKIADARPCRGSLCTAWGLALLSAFTYELGQCYAVLAGTLLAVAVAPQIGRPRAVGLVAAFVAVAVIYQAANAVDKRIHEGEYQPDHASRVVRERAFSKATLTHSGRYAVFTTVQPFFPSLSLPVYSGQRLQFIEDVWSRNRMRAMKPALALSYGVVTAAVVLGLAGFWRLARERERLPLLVLLIVLGLYAGYAAMNVLGRMNLRPGPHILRCNSYYTYPSLLFGLLVAAVGWQAVRGGWDVPVRKGLAVGLLALGVLGAERVWEMNTKITHDLREWWKPLRSVQEFVDEHRHEKGFSFSIDYAASDPIPDMYGIPITRMVFSKWMSDEPRYRLVFRQGQAELLPEKEKAVGR